MVPHGRLGFLRRNFRVIFDGCWYLWRRCWHYRLQQGLGRITGLVVCRQLKLVLDRCLKTLIHVLLVARDRLVATIGGDLYHLLQRI